MKLDAYERDLLRKAFDALDDRFESEISEERSPNRRGNLRYDAAQAEALLERLLKETE